MQHRIFIAVNLPENIKKKLSDYESRWPEIPCRWTKRDSLHITLNFLGYLTDEELLEIIKIVREIASRHDPFFLNLRSVVYGPKGKPPRMIWTEGETSEELGKLREDLAKGLEGFSKESTKEQGYTPHITLGRLKQWEFQKMEPEEKPEVNEKINFNFEVSSIEIMESELKRNGPEYTVLESSPLNL
ncbi:MAG: RNA 2',3'-cyclic phosphodiesterase [bacterium]|nr:RNA 2',3'-cyclic phosphodiesterase [bacterium]